MKLRGTLKQVSRDWQSERWQITFEMTEGNINDLDKLRDKDLSIEAKQYRNSRSLTANGLLWACLGEMAEALHADKWDIYLQELRAYGQYTLLDMEPGAVEKFKQIYRECEDIGYRIVDGREMRQVLCYYGSSTYNSKEFSALLDGVIEDMKNMNLPTPTSQDMQRVIAELEAANG